MPAIKFAKFLGEAPKIATELLPDGAAQVAYNTKFYSGDLVPYHDAKRSEVPITDAVGKRLKTLYALKNPDGSKAWLTWEDDVDIAVASSSAENEQRFYYTGDGTPKVSNYALAITPEASITSYDLGLPLPNTVLTATAAGHTTTGVLSVSRDAGNTATVVTDGPHNLKSGNIVSVYNFNPDDEDTDVEKTAGSFNTTNVQVTVTASNVIKYFSPGDVVENTDNASTDCVTTLAFVQGDTFPWWPSTVATEICTYILNTDGKVALAGGTQERTYVYTWLTPWGEESIASVPSEAIYVKEGQKITLSGLPTENPSSSHYIRGLRIYRTLASASSTEYYRLSTLWFPQQILGFTRADNEAFARCKDPHNLLIGDMVKVRSAEAANAEFNTAVTVPATSEVTNADGSVVAATAEYIEYSAEVIDIHDDFTFIYKNTGADTTGESSEQSAQLIHDVSENLGDVPRFWDVTDGGVADDYTDDFIHTSLSEILSSDNYDAPPKDLTGLRVANNNILVGFFSNQVCFSDTDSPHAWPLDYRITLDSDIVAIEPTSGYIVVLTKEYPYTISGSNPTTMTVSRIDTMYPCLSKRSVVNTGYGVVYATHGGLAVYSVTKGLELVTKLVHDWNTWPAAVTPHDVVGHFVDGAYFGSHPKESFIFEADAKVGGYFSTVSTTFDSAWTDQNTNQLFFTKDDTGYVYEWDAEDTPKLTASWKSKTLVTKPFINLGAAKVVAEFDTSQAEIDAITEYNIFITGYNAQVVWSNYTELNTLNAHSIGGGLTATIGASLMGGDRLTRKPRDVLDNSCVTFKLWANKELVFEKVVCDTNIFRLPTGYRTDTYEVGISGATTIKAIHIAETPYGLRES